MSIESFIKRKGNYLILKQLKINGKNYNSIKKELFGLISARTLDHRLKELMTLKILENTNISDDQSIKTKYYLTYKGIVILTCLETMENLISRSLSPEEFQNEFNLKLINNSTSNFNLIWIELKKILQDNHIIFTLKKKKPNELIGINNSNLIIQTGKGVDTLPITKIENAWVNFVEKGFLKQNDYEETSYRSSFILALFSLLPFVKVDEGPPLTIKLELKT